MKTNAKTLPHSIEAEEYVLSACMIEGGDIMARCMMQRITSFSFYDPKHGEVFAAMAALYGRGESTDAAFVAEELKKRGKLEFIGGYPFILQVSGKSPTTAQAVQWISKVKAYATIRDIQNAARAIAEDCDGFNGDLGAVFESIRGRMAKAEQIDEQADKGFFEFDLPPEDDAKTLLGRNRYISRGDGVVLVSSSGMGKSVMNYQWAATCALGKPFLGIETKGALKSLIIQAEDADGDIGEVGFSLRAALKLNNAEVAQVNKNVVVVREKIARGDAFLAKMRMLVDKHKPDLVWINPLHSYAGCNVSDAEELGHFLRAGLNVVNKDEAFAIIVIHHTPKPITAKGVPEKKWNEFMYDAAGSAELVNWARAVITIKPTETEGEFNLILAKRGKRAGVMIEKPGAGDGITRLELTTKIPVKHSTERVNIEGRKHPFNIVCWVARDPDAEPVKEPIDQSKKRNSKSFEKLHTSEQLIEGFPDSSTAAGDPMPAIRSKLLGAGIEISMSTLRRNAEQMMSEGLVERTEHLTWKRTDMGDLLVKKILTNRK